MNRSLRLSISWQVLLASLAGTVGGWLLADLPDNPATMLCRSVVSLGGDLSGGFLRAVATPLILASLILGAVGLEPMRAVSKLCTRTLCWMAVSALAATLVGFGVAWVLVPTGQRAALHTAYEFSSSSPLPVLSAASWTWAALVLLGLSFAYYRNQVDESLGRMITRLCLAVEGMIEPLLALTMRLLPWVIFVSLLALRVQEKTGEAVQYATFLNVLRGGVEEPALRHDALLIWYGAKALLGAWLVFGLVVLPAALFLLTRLNAWRYLWSMLPAALTAFATGDVAAALPVTMHRVRQNAHVSNRVASVVISLCGAFQREGLALGLVVLAVCYRKLHGDLSGWSGGIEIVLAGWLVAFGAGALPLVGNVAPLILCQTMGWDDNQILAGWVVWSLVARGGAALSVWSHACAAAVIARGEGEFWVPGAPPTPEELQGLKNDLATADN